jgi:hypothetical protein
MQAVVKLGVGDGPWQYVAEYSGPRLSIFGLVHGDVVVEYAEEPGVLHPEKPASVFDSNGVFVIDRANYIRVKHHGPSVGLVCRIVGS